MSRRHGNAPYAVTITTTSYGGSMVCPAYTLAWGDGTPNEQYTQRFCSGASYLFLDTRTHTYSQAGSYIVGYTDPTGSSNSANVRVDGPVASAENQTQLANALSALQSALEAIKKLLGQ